MADLVRLAVVREAQQLSELGKVLQAGADVSHHPEWGVGGQHALSCIMARGAAFFPPECAARNDCAQAWRHALRAGYLRLVQRRFRISSLR